VVIGHMLEIMFLIHFIYSHMSKINIFSKFPLLLNVKLIQSYVKKRLLIHFIYGCIFNFKKKIMIKFSWPLLFWGVFQVVLIFFNRMYVWSHVKCFFPLKFFTFLKLCVCWLLCHMFKKINLFFKFFTFFGCMNVVMVTC
jgi:hypothetical protein